MGKQISEVIRGIATGLILEHSGLGPLYPAFTRWYEMNPLRLVYKQIQENYFVVKVFGKHKVLGMEKLELPILSIFYFCLK